MKKIYCGIIILFLLCINVFCLAKDEEPGNRLILLISEQNISGPQTAWWMSEIDLSVTEMRIAQGLIKEGYRVIEPLEANSVIKLDKSFRVVLPSEDKAVDLAAGTKADFVVLGNAVASAGGFAPESKMRSCFANITVKLISVEDSKIMAYLQGSGSSVHTDMVTGGKEALVKAADNIVPKIIEALKTGAGKVDPKSRGEK